MLSSSKQTLTVYLTITTCHRFQAFEKAISEVNVPNGKFVLVDEASYDKALTFIREHFMPHEPIGKGMGLQWNHEQEEFYLGVLKDKLTPMLIDETTGEVIAIR